MHPIKLSKETEATQSGKSNDLVIEGDDDEASRLVNKIRMNRQTSQTQQLLEEEKQKLIDHLCCEIQNNVISFDELEAIKRITAAIGPPLDAMKSQKAIWLL